MAVYQNPELVTLFQVYTGGPDNIGAHLVRMAQRADSVHPLIVCTKTDMALYPGNGKKPSVESFRLSTRGFKELAAVSHLGPALASLVNMHALEPENDLWRKDADLLYAATLAARIANTAELWRDKIAVEAFRGREASIAAMVDYACDMTLRYLDMVRSDTSKLNAEYLRQHYLEAEPGNELGATISNNAVMIATFFLTGLDICFRVNRWFAEQQVDWPNAMVLMTGQQGRATSGVTWTTNSVCQTILYASRLKLPLERMYIAPHAASFTLTDPIDWDAVCALEGQYRALWSHTRAVSELGPAMFAGYPRYTPNAYESPVVDDQTTEVSEMPRIRDAKDMRSMTTRLRLVMEDPRQLLSGAVMDFAARQLHENGNRPDAVTVPGLDGYEYPKECE